MISYTLNSDIDQIIYDMIENNLYKIARMPELQSLM